MRVLDLSVLVLALLLLQAPEGSAFTDARPPSVTTGSSFNPANTPIVSQLIESRARFKASDDSSEEFDHFETRELSDVPSAEFDHFETREMFYKLVNPELSYTCLVQAKDYVKMVLAWTKRTILCSNVLEHRLYQSFDYSEAAFDQRLDEIYMELADYVDNYDPKHDKVFNTRAKLLERFLQNAPINLIDGNWLCSIPRLPGPVNGPRLLLLRILEDEHGNGDPALNHANVYSNTLEELQIMLPPVTSRAFAHDTSLCNEAFEMPVFLAAAAQFPATFFAILLGITLGFEWTSIEVTAIIKLCRVYGVNDLYYTLHKGIDNPVNGHGAWAVTAVKLHLADVLSARGEEAMKQEWDCIWTAYVAFRCYGSLDAAFKRMQAAPLTLTQRMMHLVYNKRYAARSHDHARIDGEHSSKVRDLFDDPELFVAYLATSKRLIVPGRPKDSQFMKDMAFDGPMFRVFDDGERELVSEWITELGASSGDDFELPDAKAGR